VLVANREHRLLESPALDLRQEGRKLFFRCQRRSPRLVFCSRDER